MTKKVSIIIRTKNEERWVGHCLSMVYQQTYKNFEVILVDNDSTDNTLGIVKRYPVEKIVQIEKFKPGLAINLGIRASDGDLLVCLSAHCVPKDRDWLELLVRNFEDNPNLAGVYGRQLPLSFTDDVDKRDLMIVFGLDRRVQFKDPFFHNANSMFRRDVWERIPFDEEVTNIEDRVWGKKVIEAGYQIVYDPDPAVYHHHGLHQGNSPKRVRGVVSIIEKLEGETTRDIPESWKPENAPTIALLPIREKIPEGSEEMELLRKTLGELKSSKYVDQVYFVSTQTDLATAFEVKLIDRSKIEDADNLGVDEILVACLSQLESLGEFPENILYVNYDYVNRPPGLFDQLISDAQYKGLDTFFPGLIDFGHYWIKDESEDYKQTDASMKVRDKREPIYRALYGLGTVMSSTSLRKGKMIGGKVGILPVEDSELSKRLKD